MWNEGRDTFVLQWGMDNNNKFIRLGEASHNTRNIFAYEKVSRFVDSLGYHNCQIFSLDSYDNVTYN